MSKPTHELRASDLAAVGEQLGREPTTVFDVVARCTGGHPLVIRNATRDVRGDPFPTTYWLTCMDAVSAVSRLEADGGIRELNARYDEDPAFSAAVDEAHREAAFVRGELEADAASWGGVGGTRRGLKCLHAHYANRLGGGDDPVGVWVAERIEPIHPEQREGRIAAIDQGTNSCRLTVVEPAADPGGQPCELARDMVITRLGEGVDRAGMLDSAALERTFAVLERYCRRARALSAQRIRVAATSAVRDAGNRQVFADRVRAYAGSELKVLTGEQEAALSFLGGTRGLDQGWGPFLVVDIGGGSTEFVVGPVARAEESTSMQMGSVRLTERFVRTDPPADEDLHEIDLEIDRVLDLVEARVQVARARTLVSVGGTGTTLQAIALGLPWYDPDRTHRTWLSADDADRVVSELRRMTNAERAAIPVMAPGRGDVIVAGASILVRAMRRFGFERALVSESDILDGLAFDALEGSGAGNHPPDPAGRSVP